MLANFVLAALLSPILASDCELSEWSTWSRCHGTCFYALSVRNRDVIRPALPDKPQGPIKRCAHLYETRFCAIPSCQEGSSSDVVDLPSRSGHQQPSVRVIVEKKFLRKGQLETAVAAAVPEITRSKAHISGEVIPPRTKEKQLESSHQRRNYYGQLTRTIEALQQHLNQEDPDSESLQKEIAAENEPRPLKSRLEEDKEKQSTLVSTLTIDLPKHLKPARERKPTTSKEPWKPLEERIIESHTSTQSIGREVPRELESTTDYKIPINDMRIRRVLHRNKKLMKALIEAYKLRFTTSTFPSTTTSHTNIATTAASTNEVSEGVAPVDFASDVKMNEVVTKGTPTSTENVPVPSTEGTTTDSFTTTTETEALDQNATTEYLHTTTKINGNKPPTWESPLTFATEQMKDSEDFTESTTAEQMTNPSTESSNDLELQADTIEVPAENMTNSDDLQEVERASSTTEGINHSKQEVTPSPSNTEPTTVMTSTSAANSTASTVSTTTQLPYWPKKGYVPNTRKHASEITSKLYMTREIVQVLSEDPIRRPAILKLDCLENKRCCKVTRTECSDGSPPKLVKRYYRPRGSDTCLPYHYPRCSPNEEMEEQPIQYEQNCQDLCFAGPEKRIAPLLQLAIEK